jgi:hypothetical protein
MAIKSDGTFFLRIFYASLSTRATAENQFNFNPFQKVNNYFSSIHFNLYLCSGGVKNQNVQPI